jgi:uncharacterized protein YdeI (YjbR/CyaY-like superfamily)
MNLEINPIFFENQEDFRKWLEKNHNTEKELFVGYYKISSEKHNMTWSQSVDQALCFGWIDGIRKSIDKESYFIRFTPRKPKSIWSSVNINKFNELSRAGLMKPAGIAAFKLREESNSKIYSYENEELKLPEEFDQLFKANGRAWSYFQSLPPSYRKVSTRWVMSAKQEVTRIKRLDELIRDCEAGRKIKALNY